MEQDFSHCTFKTKLLNKIKLPGQSHYHTVKVIAKNELKFPSLDENVPKGTTGLIHPGDALGCVSRLLPIYHCLLQDMAGHGLRDVECVIEDKRKSVC